MLPLHQSPRDPERAARPEEPNNSRRRFGITVLGSSPLGDLNPILRVTSAVCHHKHLAGKCPEGLVSITWSLEHLGVRSIATMISETFYP